MPTPTQACYVSMHTCPNCAGELKASFGYCPRCGQKAHLHRFSLHEIFHEAFHAVTHADKGVLLLIKGLALQPGVVAREYVLEGKRKRYFNPFTFLALVLGIALTANALVHPYTGNQRVPPKAAATALKPQEAEIEGFKARRVALSAFIEKRTNLVLLVSIPVFAAVFWLLFRRIGLNYAEYVVAQVLFSGFFSLVTTLLLTPLARLLPGGAYNGLQLLFQLTYLSLAYRQFFARRQPQSLLRTGLATLLAMVVWVLLSGGAGYLYIRYGG